MHTPYSAWLRGQCLVNLLYRFVTELGKLFRAEEPAKMAA